MELSYQDCFSKLEVPYDVTWNELRQAYRRQLQKWHPDKIRYTNVDLTTAETNFKAIQDAFNVLERYYLSHGTLPTIILPEKLIINENIHAHGYESHKINHPKQKNRSFLSSFMLFGISVIIISYILVNYDIKITDDISSTSNNYPVNNNTINSNPEQNNNPTLSFESKFFGIGTTMTDVIEIQGAPSKTNGNTWYYGKSFVVFNNGRVVDWHQDILSPLKTHSSNSTILRPRITTQIIAVGLSKSEVRLIQGEPMQDLVDVWVYGSSKIYFKNDRVVSWVNSTLDPLKLE